MTMQTTLERRGYTLFKKDLTADQIKSIHADLTVVPKTFAPGGNCEKKYFAYQESPNKLIIPHYYGVEHFGVPSITTVSHGDDICVNFNGDLRPNQIPVVAAYMKNVEKRAITDEVGGGLLELPCAFGKTVLGLKIISLLKKKTLIIVQKEFLMDQWIERMREFLPSARIGKIQGDVFDIEDKDIVIGMLQSLSQKAYPSKAFTSFGLTIIDEVHHISSEMFSKALFKIVTRHMLGLSATMGRKDGTTYVFKLFLGGILFKGSRDHRVVNVRGIEYISDDAEFNKLILDYRGNPAYSSMISKLCTHVDRSEFILRVLSDMFVENPKQQIMILAHNKNVLKYLYDAIAHRGIATVGYYIGGMKAAALKITESKQVVIATYSMASEALDIKSLTTLIMATPKTDIEQSIGRILRDRFSNPIVVDIIDRHSIFMNQWRKRKTYYKKEKYTVITTKSTYYNSNTALHSWTSVFGVRSKHLTVGSMGAESSACMNSDSDSEPDSDSESESGGGSKCFFV